MFGTVVASNIWESDAVRDLGFTQLWIGCLLWMHALDWVEGLAALVLPRIAVASTSHPCYHYTQADDKLWWTMGFTGSLMGFVTVQGIGMRVKSAVPQSPSMPFDSFAFALPFPLASGDTSSTSESPSSMKRLPRWMSWCNTPCSSNASQWAVVN